jgi:tetratricopeptide (TPR) repeat protein
VRQSKLSPAQAAAARGAAAAPGAAARVSGNAGGGGGAATGAGGGAAVGGAGNAAAAAASGATLSGGAVGAAAALSRAAVPSARSGIGGGGSAASSVKWAPPVDLATGVVVQSAGPSAGPAAGASGGGAAPSATSTALSGGGVTPPSATSNTLSGSGGGEGVVANATCVICLSDVQDNSTGLDGCSHTFCHSCIGRWCRVSNAFCPTCRAPITELRPSSGDPEPVERPSGAAPTESSQTASLVEFRAREEEELERMRQEYGARIVNGEVTRFLSAPRGERQNNLARAVAPPSSSQRTPTVSNAQPASSSGANAQFEALIQGVNPKRNPSSTANPAASNADSPMTSGGGQPTTSMPKGVSPMPPLNFAGANWGGSSSSSAPTPTEPPQPPAGQSADGGAEGSSADGGAEGSSAQERSGGANGEGGGEDPSHSDVDSQEGLADALDSGFSEEDVREAIEEVDPAAVAGKAPSAAGPSGQVAGAESMGNGGDNANGDCDAFDPNGFFEEDPYGDASAAATARANGASAASDAGVTQRMDTDEVAESSGNSHGSELVKKRMHYSHPPVALGGDGDKGAGDASMQFSTEQSTASSAQMDESPPAAARADEHLHVVLDDFDRKRMWLKCGQSDAGEESLIKLFKGIEIAHPDRLDAAAVKGNLAVALMRQGKFDKAEAQYFEVLTIFCKALGETHHATLQVKANLAATLRAQGKHDQAEKLMREVLSVRRDELGNAHFETQKAMYELSRLLTDRGKYDQAEALLNEVVTTQHDEADGDHPQRLMAKHDLARVLMQRGEYGGAEKILHGVVPLLRNALGDGHLETLKAMANLSAALRHRREYERAETILREVVPTSNKVLGETHPVTLKATGDLATVLKDRGEHTEAEKLVRDLVSRSREAFGDTHHDTLTVMINLGTMLRLRGEYTEAEELLKEVVQKHVKLYGIEHPQTLYVMGTHTSLLMATGAHETAETRLRWLIPRLCRVLGDKDPQTLAAKNKLSAVLSVMCKHDEAQKLLRDVESDMCTTLGKEHPASRMVTSNLESVMRNLDIDGFRAQKRRSAVNGSTEDAMPQQVRANEMPQPTHITPECLCTLSLAFTGKRLC